MLQLSRALCLFFFIVSVSAWTPVALGADRLGSNANSCTLCEFSTPELWVVNTRCAPTCSGLDEGFDQITFEKWDAESKRFSQESLESFLAAQADIPTMLFSHGNTLTHEQAMEFCWKIYQRLRVCGGPKLMVYWSWPAQVIYKKPILRPFELAEKNIRTKYTYAEYQGYYIAKLTQLMSKTQPLTLSGHSFGGVTVISALHYLAGGQLNCLTLAGGDPAEISNLRAVIISGAFDNDSLYPNYRYGHALDAVQLFYLTYNDRDATLKRWPSLSLRGQQAAGYTGICASRLGVNSCKLVQDRLTEDVKRSHYIRPHLESVKMMSSLCKTAFNSEVYSCPGGQRSLAPAGNLTPQQLLQLPAQTVFPGLGL